MGFRLHLTCRFNFYLGGFSYTSHVQIIFMQGISQTHPVLASFLSREFLLHIPRWLPVFVFCLGSSFFTSRIGFFLFYFFYFFIGGVSLTHPGLAWILMRRVSLPHTVLLDLYTGSFSYTSRAGFVFYLETFSYTSRASLKFYAGSFSYTSRAAWCFMRGVSLTHPVLASFLSGEFLLHIPRWLQFFFWEVSLTHPVLPLFLCWEFLLHIPCWNHFHAGNFSNTSRAGFIFISGVSLTHPTMAWNLMQGVSLTHHVLLDFLCAEFLLHIPYLLHFLFRKFLLHIACWLPVFVFDFV